MLSKPERMDQIRHLSINVGGSLANACRHQSDPLNDSTDAYNAEVQKETKQDRQIHKPQCGIDQLLCLVTPLLG